MRTELVKIPEKEKTYILDIKGAMKRRNAKYPALRKMNISQLAEKIGATPAWFVKVRKPEIAPKWIKRPLILTEIVPSKFTDVIRIEGGLYSVNFKKVKDDYNAAHPELKQIQISDIKSMLGYKSDVKSKSNEGIKNVYLICQALECEPADIIFKV